MAGKPINKNPNAHEVNARQAGESFGKEILSFMENWQGPSTILTLAGYIAHKNEMPIGKTQMTAGLGMLTAGLIAEIIRIQQENPEVDIAKAGKQVARWWSGHIQGPSNVSLAAGIVGMLSKIKGAEAAFVAGAIGTVINLSSYAFKGTGKER